MTLRTRLAALLAAATLVTAVPPAAAQTPPGAQASQQQRMQAIGRRMAPSIGTWIMALKELNDIYEARRRSDPSAPTLTEALEAKAEHMAPEAQRRMAAFGNSANFQQTLAQLQQFRDVLGDKSPGQLGAGQQDAVTAAVLRAGFAATAAEDDGVKLYFDLLFDLTEATIPAGTSEPGIVALLDRARALNDYSRQQAEQDLGIHRQNAERNMEEITSTMREVGIYRDPNDTRDMIVLAADGTHIVMHANGDVTTWRARAGDGAIFVSRDGRVPDAAMAEIRRLLGNSPSMAKVIVRATQIGKAAAGGGNGLVDGMTGASIDAATLDELRALLPNGQLPHLPPIPQSTFDMFTQSGGSITSVQFEAIYANYQQSPTATTWTSLNLYPPGPSSTATTPAIDWYSFSSVGTSLSSAGNSLSSLGTSLSAAGTSLPFDWISMSAVGNNLPIDAAAYDAPQLASLQGTSGPLSGQLAWLMSQRPGTSDAWFRPGDPRAAADVMLAALQNIDPALAAFFTDLLLGQQLSGERDPLRSTIKLGELLADSRNIASSGGLSDIGISGLLLRYILRDFGTQDGDLVNIRLTQFGRVLYEGRLSLLNAGTAFAQPLRRGVAELTITALNEGSLPPNTAAVRIDDVVRGDAEQSYSLRTGESATLRIESNVQPGGR